MGVDCWPSDRQVARLGCFQNYSQLPLWHAPPRLLPRDSLEIQAWPGFCKSRGSTWEMESLALPSLKRMVSPSRKSPPFVNPFDPSHQLPMLKAGDLAGHLAQRVFTTPLPLAPGQTTTPGPTRFFPKGQIKLDRFPAGFNF